MQTKRTYSIKVITQSDQDFYVAMLIKYDIGYRVRYETTKIKSAGVWVNKKKLEKIIEKLNLGLFQPGFYRHNWQKYKYEIVETTPTKTLRMLKMKKINKN